VLRQFAVPNAIIRAPRPWFAKHDDGGAAKAKDRLFLTALEWDIERMNLNDPSNRQGSHLHEPEATPSEMAVSGHE
jgi:hypothetical protein